MGLSGYLDLLEFDLADKIFNMSFQDNCECGHVFV
jgi:hypothetical protein